MEKLKVLGIVVLVAMIAGMIAYDCYAAEGNGGFIFSKSSISRTTCSPAAAGFKSISSISSTTSSTASRTTTSSKSDALEEVTSAYDAIQKDQQNSNAASQSIAPPPSPAPAVSTTQRRTISTPTATTTINRQISAQTTTTKPQAPSTTNSTITSTKPSRFGF